jgi:integrase/recombinase XerD
VKDRADTARKRGTSRAVIDELIVLLLLNTGLRTNELCGLKIKDLPVMHNEKTIWIRKKNKITRKVEVPEDLIELLKRFVKLYRNGAKQNDLLLESERGNAFSYISLYSKIKRIGEASGIGKLSLAMLRLTYVKRLYDTEQDLRYVREQAGYASIRTTANNIHIKKTRKKSKATQKCEACGVNINKGKGRKIDSGQLICSRCQKYFKSTS